MILGPFLLIHNFDKKRMMKYEFRVPHSNVGDYDGHTGPSQSVREERVERRDIKVAKQFGRDLHDFDVEMPSMVEQTNMTILVDANDGRCEPKRRKLPQKEKLFATRLENAWKSKNICKIRSVNFVSDVNRLFEVGSSATARNFYQVRVTTQPSCSCKDFQSFGERSPCKHLLFVLLFCQKITDELLLQKTAFTAEEVQKILLCNFIDKDLLLPKKSGKSQKSGSKRNAAFFREIMAKHQDYGSPLKFLHVTKVGRSASCSGFKCQNPLMVGDNVVRVPKAVGVPYGKEIAVQTDYFFCPKRLCIRNPPVWTNIKYTEDVVFEKGESITDAEHSNLLDELKGM